MSNLRITFLGTGTSQGVPVIGSKDPVCLSDDPKDKRLRSSVMLEWEGGCYVIDCGPDFRQQMLNAKAQKLDGILFTHYHADHTAGLDDVRPFSLREGYVNIYAGKDTIENLEERFGYIFATVGRYAGAPKLKVHEIKMRPFELGGKEVVPIRIMHGKLPILGYRIENFAYLTDVKTIEPAEMEKLRGLDALVINALRIDWHPTHLNLEEALALVEDLKPKRAYFTHISHRLGFHEEVQKKLPTDVYLAYDGLRVISP